MELALSIQRWMSKDDPDDDVGDVEKNAKGPSFLLESVTGPELCVFLTNHK